MPTVPETISRLQIMRRCLPEAAAALNIDLGQGFTHWHRTLDRKILPRLDPGFPLVAAICGGGSTGKSTLFNAMAGTTFSPTGGRAGLNRRVLMAVRDRGPETQAHLAQLHQAFASAPTRLEHPDQLLEPGPPLYCTSDSIAEHLVLLDTPDIDTGAKGCYANRDLARQSLEIADLFIYIFTNTTYNNLDNTDFISNMLTGMGARPCYLVYRVYASFSDDEVREHAAVVAANLYGAEMETNVLGLYRADEDNAVAAGDAAITLRPVAAEPHTLPVALSRLDIMALRSRLLESMMDDALAHGRRMAGRVLEALAAADAYAQALEQSQQSSVQLALAHFPTDRVLRRFARIWLESDPAHIKFMRRTGAVIQWPMKTIATAVRRFKDTPEPVSSEGGETLDRQVEMDLLTAANRLYNDMVNEHITMDGRQISAPAATEQERAELQQRNWESALKRILDQKTTVLSWSVQLDEDLRRLADELRARMGVVDQIRQTFAALLNVIPATAAVTYVLHTGDPVGAAGIKVKLTGFLGLHDLYALIAIPATAGMSKADRSQLERLLQPLARTWLEHKSKAVHALFERHITGTVSNRLKSVRTQTVALLQEMGIAIAPSTTRGRFNR